MVAEEWIADRAVDISGFELEEDPSEDSQWEDEPESPTRVVPLYRLSSHGFEAEHASPSHSG